ncbi:MAG: PAS domain-containing protein [Chitinispirillaceae bacterium]|nr:PAS domain-containing protein [Chitinispirillaceae bacterium]
MKTKSRKGTYLPKKIKDILVKLPPHDAQVISDALDHLKNAEEGLSKSEARFKSFTENAPDFVIQIGHDGAIQFINRTHEGISQVDVVGSSVFSWIPENHIPTFKQALAQLFETAQAQVVEHPAWDAQKGMRWYSSHLGPIGERGNVASAIIIARDITARKRAQDKLRDEMNSHQALLTGLASTGIGVDIVGTDYRVRFQNAVLQKRFGDCKGKLCYESYMGLQTPCDFCPMKKAIAGNRVEIVELTGVDGKEYELISAPLATPDGTIESAVEVIRDVTEQKHVEEELQKIQKLESLGVLAGGIAHDFNNLLGGLFGFIDLARVSIHHDVDAQAYIESAMQCFSRAKDLTQQLLTFAKGGSPQKKPLSLEHIINESIKLSLSGTNIRCEKNFQHRVHSIEGDHGQMNQIFNNILLNSRHAMPNGGMIRIEAYNREIKQNEISDLSEGVYVSITVRDQGTGIPQDYLTKVFDPFFTTKQSGSGLGLATTYSIVRKHGGHISIQSELGNGTTVNIILPAIIDDIQEGTGETASLFHRTGRILLMDDEESIRKVASEMISRMGYDIVCVENGEKAIQAYSSSLKARNKFNSVILDLTVVHGIGGEETIRRLFEIDPNVKAIVSSGYSDSPVLANPKEHGFLNSIAKPYCGDELSKVLNDVLKDEG